jgi:hypothetical protein
MISSRLQNDHLNELLGADIATNCRKVAGAG